MRSKALIFGMAFLCASCSSFYVEFDPGGNDATVPDHFVPMDVAQKTVSNILGSMSTKASFGRSVSESFLVDSRFLLKSTEKVSPGDSIPPFYVFNFENGRGYALVAADDRMCPLLCLVDTGTFCVDSSLTNPGQMALLSRMETDYKMAINMPVTDATGRIVYPEEYNLKAALTLPSLLLSESEDDDAGYWTTDPAEVIDCSNPYLDTQWGQRSFFNELMYNSSGEKCPAGCTNIALAQVMNFHGGDLYLDGYYIDWDEIGTVKDSTSARRGTALGRYMLQHFLYSTAVHLQANMTPSGTGIDPSLIPDYLESFNYASGGTESDYNFSTLMSDIVDGYPVLLEGYSKKIVKYIMGQPVTTYDNGHEWVGDGYLTVGHRHTWHSYTNPSNNYSYYSYTRLPHCNFGWYGAGDGYYYSGSYNVNTGPAYLMSSHPAKQSLSPMADTTGTNGYYQYRLSMITGIRHD